MDSTRAARRSSLGALGALLAFGAAGCGLLAKKETPRPTQPSRAVRRPARPSPRPTRREKGVHVVRRGETLWSIARRYGVSVDDLREANHMSASDVLLAGARLRIPGAEEAVETPPPVEPEGPMPASEGRFVWPVRGRVQVRFGQKSGGFPSRGLVIAAREGQVVAAAKSGRVCFVSQAFEGWGKVVVIQHAGGWNTLYGHLGRILVRPGQTVRQGQPIGEVGRTGRAERPQLAFRVFYHGRPLNPESYLR